MIGPRPLFFPLRGPRSTPWASHTSLVGIASCQLIIIINKINQEEKKTLQWLHWHHSTLKCSSSIFTCVRLVSNNISAIFLQHCTFKVKSVQWSFAPRLGRGVGVVRWRNGVLFAAAAPLIFICFKENTQLLTRFALKGWKWCQGAELIPAQDDGKLDS